jgi:hypothetical protein
VCDSIILPLTLSALDSQNDAAKEASSILDEKVICKNKNTHPCDKVREKERRRKKKREMSIGVSIDSTLE